MNIDKIINEKLKESNYGITKEIAKKYCFELSDIYLQDAKYILKRELKNVK